MKPVDMVALIMAITVSLIVLMAVADSMFLSDLHELEIEVLGDTVAAMTSIIAVYVGTKLRGD